MFFEADIDDFFVKPVLKKNPYHYKMYNFVYYI